MIQRQVLKHHGDITKNYGNILLSFDRVKGYYLNDIEVLEEISAEILVDCNLFYLHKTNSGAL